MAAGSRPDPSGLNSSQVFLPSLPAHCGRKAALHQLNENAWVQAAAALSQGQQDEVGSRPDTPQAGQAPDQHASRPHSAAGGFGSQQHAFESPGGAFPGSPYGPGAHICLERCTAQGIVELAALCVAKGLHAQLDAAANAICLKPGSSTAYTEAALATKRQLASACASLLQAWQECPHSGQHLAATMAASMAAHTAPTGLRQARPLQAGMQT